MKTAIGFIYFGFIAYIIASSPNGWQLAPVVVPRSLMLFGAALLIYEVVRMSQKPPVD